MNLMKNSITILAGVALLCACQPTDSKGRIDLELTDMKSDTVLVGSYLISDLNHENLKMDTLLPGQTSYTYVADTDTTAYQVFITSTADRRKSIVLALCPGEQIKVTGTIEDWQVEGSELNADYAAIQKACRPYQAKMTSLEKAMTDEIYKNEYIPTWHRMDSLQADYVRQHPDKDLSLFILSEIKGKWVRELLPTLSPEVKNGPLAPIAQTFEEGFRRSEIFAENKKKVVEGTEAPDFTLNDPQGEPLSLSSLRGRYVVLDFWGSWCGSCIKDFPEMKKYYEKYKGRMEFLGIDCHDKEEEWRAALEKHDAPWLHVRSDKESDISLLYAVNVYPTKIVIDPEGKIAKIVLGEGRAFYEYLDTLLK